MPLIDDFIKEEEHKMSWLDMLVGNYPKVRSTPELTDTFQHLRLGNEKVISPPLWQKVVTIHLLLLTGGLWGVSFYELFVSHMSLFSLLFSLALDSLLIFIVVSKSFLNKRLNYIITVNYEGISIKDCTFYWTVIDELYIMSKLEGRNRNNYLVIVKKDAAIEKFNLYLFGISSRNFSTIIEYYRTGQKVS